MAATERVTILMEPAQKAALTEQAQNAGLSVGEYIRDYALGDSTVLTAMVKELRASTRDAVRAIDATLLRLGAREAEIAAREAEARRKAHAEFAEINVDTLGRLFEGGGAVAIAAPKRRAMR